MKRILFPLFALAVSVLLMSDACQAQTATTDPVGFTKLNVSVGTSLVVPTLTNASVYTGMATISADGMTITPTTAPGWTAGAYAKTAFQAPIPNFPAYYAEIISGAQEGFVIDIDSNSATALTAFANDIPSTSGLRGQTVQIALRQHMTLDKVIAGSTGLSAYQDSISVYNSDGTQSICNYDGTSFVDRNFTNPVGQTIIYPGTGFVISVSNPVSLTFLGGVKTTKTQVPLYSGVTNIVGPLNPASSTLLYGYSSLAAALAAYQDGINNYSSDGKMTATPYSSDGTSILDRNFNPLPANAPDAINLNAGVVISVNATRIWVVNSPLAP